VAVPPKAKAVKAFLVKVKLLLSFASSICSISSLFSAKSVVPKSCFLRVF